MISFLLRKMWKNKWLMLSLLVGNILIIGVAASTPMYSMAIITRMMHQSARLVQVEEGVYPVFTRFRYVFNLADDPVREYEETRDVVIDKVLNTLIVPASNTVRAYTMSNWLIRPASWRQILSTRVNLWAVPYFEENIVLTGGRMPSEFAQDGVIEVLATDMAMFRNDFAVEELMVGSGAYVRIVGVFEIPLESLPFWAMQDIDFESSLFLHENVIRYQIIPYYHQAFNLSATWSTVHDYTLMTAGNVQRYKRGIDQVDDLARATSKWSFEQNYYHLMGEHIERSDEFNLTLILLQIPVYALLAFYIYVVSRKILQQEQNDISVIKSRGASRRQILGIYAGQGLVIGVLSFPAGAAFGMFICHVLGASGGFLYIMQRAPVVVQLSAQALVFGGAAALFSFCAMVLPVIKFSKVGIVEHKRGKGIKKALWQRFFLDVVCLGASIFGLYSFNIQQDLAPPMNDFVDPTMFLISTLFIVGLGLFCLRVFPYIVKLVFFFGRRFMPISLYTAMVRVARSAGEEQFIMIFLVFAMAIGIFNAQTARTINLNTEHEISYLSGADLVFEPAYRDNRASVLIHLRVPPPDGPNLTELIFQDIYIEPYVDFDQIEAFTRVMTAPIPFPVYPPRNRTSVDIQMRRGGVTVQTFPDVNFMAIETQSFGRTVWFRDDILPIHINYYLNVLGQVQNGVLVSSDFRDAGFAVGDVVILHHTYIVPAFPGVPAYPFFDDVPTSPPRPLYWVPFENEAAMIIVGFVDRWPAFVPFERRIADDGYVTTIENSIVIANLGYLLNEWDTHPYQVWARTNTQSNAFFRDFMRDEPISTILHDREEAISRARMEPLVQGTNGVLTVNFVITLIVCFAGFLLYWILSIRERVLQFGIFRAMGMGLRSIIGMLINEQMLITATALIIGAIVGEVSARLFVPLIQLSYTSQIIPLLVVMEVRDYATLFVVMGSMIVVCLVVLISFISRIRIDQALKLGED